MSDIYTCQPINKTAALVVGQEGCGIKKNATTQRMENLRHKLAVSKNYLKLAKGKRDRKIIGKEISQIELELNKLKMNGKIQKYRALSNCIIDILKPRYTKFQWQKIMDEALKLKEENNLK